MSTKTLTELQSATLALHVAGHALDVLDARIADAEGALLDLYRRRDELTAARDFNRVRWLRLQADAARSRRAPGETEDHDVV
jgi:hypothetical protein